MVIDQLDAPAPLRYEPIHTKDNLEILDAERGINQLKEVITAANKRKEARVNCEEFKAAAIFFMDMPEDGDKKTQREKR